MKVYVAGPLFNDMERQRNVGVERVLRRLGFDVYLPQKHGGLLPKMARRGSARSSRRRVFAADVAAIRACDVMLCLLDGRVPDEGMCVELGMAWALGKACVGYRTDFRVHDATGEVNLMIEGCLAGVARDEAGLASLLRRARSATSATATARGGRRSPPARRRRRAGARRRSAPRPG